MERLAYLRKDLADWGFRLAPSHAIASFRIAVSCMLFLMWLSVLLHAKTLSAVEWLFFLAVLLNLFLICIGAWMRIAAIIVTLVYGYEWWLLASSGAKATNITGEAEAIFFFVIFLILAFSGADRAFSIAMQKRYGAAMEWEDVCILPQRLLALVISCVYIVIGYHKLWQPIFRSGASLQSTLIGPWGTAVAAKFARAIPSSVFNWLLYILKAFGLMVPACLWLKSVRSWFMIGGLLLHIAMAVLLNVWWTLVLIPGYLLFLEPEEVQELSERLFKKKNDERSVSS